MVYPRACGGTTYHRSAARCATGLSPRMRGNPHNGNQDSQYFGSIPAHAGEPIERRSRCCEAGVYPRACGGTSVDSRSKDLFRGLSPRMRGNQFLVAAGFDQRGSIPAHAGEPIRIIELQRTSGVYPRACGGTVNVDNVSRPGLGLSPRMRGNRDDPAALPPLLGSIPAHAGEPAHRRPPTRRFAVYPRACGGTRMRI